LAGPKCPRGKENGSKNPHQKATHLAQRKRGQRGGGGGERLTNIAKKEGQKKARGNGICDGEDLN